MRILDTRTLALVALVFVLGLVAGRACIAEDSPPAPEPAAVAGAEVSVWTCSMHPQVRLPEPGQCPVCFMDLIPADAGGDDGGLGPRALRMTAAAVALAEIRTAPVERHSVAHEVHMVGKVAFDETRLAYITSWVAGRLDRLFVDYTGVNVRRDDHLVEIYSPTLYSAQQELLQAIATAERLRGSSLDIVKDTSDQTVVSSREKLRLYGLGDEQIQAIVERGVPSRHITLRAPIGGVVVHKNALEGMYVEEGSPIYTIADLSKVWVLLDAYESDLAWLRYGQDVEFGVEAYPGEVFHGRVAFIDPLLDDHTRTVKIRLNVDNADGRLKPDMFVSARAHAVLTAHGRVVDEDLAGKWICPMHPEVVGDGPGACSECEMDLVPAGELGFVTEPAGGESLVIPRTAPLVTGRRAVVYVRVPGEEQPTFEGREIALGPLAGDWYVVHEGLREGEQVVVNGGFKIDSELQIRARPSMMSSAGGGAGGGGAHFLAPERFREQLGDVVGAYLALQGALADDRDDPDAARAVSDAVGGIDMALLDGAAHSAWMERQPGLREAAARLAGAGALEARRRLLAPLTEQLAAAVKAFGYRTGAGPVGVFHCPMALDGDGADWIQAGERTSNPYYGAEMLRCGSRTELLEQGD